MISGSGDLYFAIHDQMPVLDINLDLDNLDLDSIISQEALKIENYELAKVIEDIAIKKNFATNNNEIIANNSKLVPAKTSENIKSPNKPTTRPPHPPIGITLPKPNVGSAT